MSGYRRYIRWFAVMTQFRVDGASVPPSHTKRATNRGTRQGKRCLSAEVTDPADGLRSEGVDSQHVLEPPHPRPRRPGDSWVQLAGAEDLATNGWKFKRDNVGRNARASTREECPCPGRLPQGWHLAYPLGRECGAPLGERQETPTRTPTRPTGSVHGPVLPVGAARAGCPTRTDRLFPGPAVRFVVWAVRQLRITRG